MKNEKMNRRGFVKRSSVVLGTGAVMSLPNVITRARAEQELIIGEGDYKYRVHHDYPKLPSKYSWQTTHNVAVDKAGNLYVIHEGRANLKDHPSIFVFDAKGKFIRAFGNQYQGGGHGIEVRQEGDEEFLYVCGYQQVKAFSKMTLDGKVVWHKHAPMDSGVYAKGENTDPKKVWGRNRFMPTNFAFLPNGDFYLIDGYGSFYTHLYDRDGNWKTKFGGPGKGEGKYATPHGIWIDNRPGRKTKQAEIVICDRAHHTLQIVDLKGNYKQTITGFGLPANIDTYKNQLLVPELHARITILDEAYKPLVRLGADVERVTKGKNIRGRPDQWLKGKFVHPHDACFDNNGNIFVAEWVHTGRVTKLVRV